jgi:hypothetical protein
MPGVWSHSGHLGSAVNKPLQRSRRREIGVTSANRSCGARAAERQGYPDTTMRTVHTRQARRWRIVIFAEVTLLAYPVFAKGADSPGPIPEETQGLAYSVHSYCGVDAAIVTFWKSFLSWRASGEGNDVTDIPEARYDYLRRVGKMPKSRPCVACLSADFATRRFAPLALEASGRHDLARKLRRLRPIRTPGGARVAYERVATILEIAREERSASATRTDVIEAAQESLERAQSEENTRANEYTSDDGDWCVDFEAFEDSDDKTMKTLALAVNAGLSKRQANHEAQAVLRALVRLARGKSAGSTCRCSAERQGVSPTNPK